MKGLSPETFANVSPNELRQGLRDFGARFGVQGDAVSLPVGRQPTVTTAAKPETIITELPLRVIDSKPQNSGGELPQPLTGTQNQMLIAQNGLVVLYNVTSDFISTV